VGLFWGENLKKMERMDSVRRIFWRKMRMLFLEKGKSVSFGF
jgi:hypothetical protein